MSKEKPLDDIEFFRKESLFSTSEDDGENDTFNVHNLQNSLNDDVFEDDQTHNLNTNLTAGLLDKNKDKIKSSSREEDERGQYYAYDTTGLLNNRKSGPVEHEDSRNENKKTVPSTKKPSSNIGTSIKVQHDETDSQMKTNHRQEKVHLRLIDQSYTRENIIYKQTTFCVCKDDECTCQMNDSSPEKIIVPEYTNRRSEIHFMLTDEYYEYSGMNLYSTNDGHFIEVVDYTSKYYLRLSLRNMDNILGFDYQAIWQYQHDIVLQMLRYMLTRPKNESIKLTIERQEENLNKEVIEVKINVEVITRGDPSVNINAETEYSPRRRLFIKNVKRAIYGSRFGSERCIRNAAGNDYVTPATGDRLLLRTLRNDDRKQNMFRCYYFQGLCCTDDIPDPIFIGVFQSCYNDMYIMATGSGKLTLVNGTLNTKIDKILTADPRFFVVRKMDKGRSYFESLLFRDHYWKAMKNELRLAECSEADIYIGEGLQFELYPNS